MTRQPSLPLTLPIGLPAPVAAGTPRYSIGKAMAARLRKRGIMV